MKPLRTVFALLLAGLLVGLGCDSKDEEKDAAPAAPEPRSLEIVMTADTLTFWPEDSLVAEGWVVVEDENGRTMPGVRVVFSLAGPDGRIELPDTTRDTTNVAGRVRFRVRATLPGAYTIGAAVDDLAADFRVVLQRPAVERYLLSLELNAPEPLCAGDTIRFCVAVTDSLLQPQVGLLLPAFPNGGRMSALAPTDTAGVTCGWWLPGDSGHFCLYAGSDSWRDSVCVTVPSIPLRPVSLFLAMDTVRVHYNQPWEVPASVAVWDESGSRLPGVPVAISFSVPCAEVAFADTVLQDTTDAFGQVAFRILGHGSTGPCVTEITASVGGCSRDRQPLVIELFN